MGAGTTMSQATSGTTSGASSGTSGGTSSGTSGAGVTTGVTTSSGSSSGGTTESIDPCPWYWPENRGLEFCPAPSGVGTEISGTTPFGPASFKFALFGLQQCSFCPEASSPMLMFFSEPPGVDVEQPPGDFLRFGLWSGTVAYTAGRVAGNVAKPGNNVEVIVEFSAIPSVEETAPPLDEMAPPVLSGNITIQGEGWQLGGTFVASLCTGLDWSIACE